jgi:hypothetical protein
MNRPENVVGWPMDRPKRKRKAPKSSPPRESWDQRTYSPVLGGRVSIICLEEKPYRKLADYKAWGIVITELSESEGPGSFEIIGQPGIDLSSILSVLRVAEHKNEKKYELPPDLKEMADQWAPPYWQEVWTLTQGLDKSQTIRSGRPSISDGTKPSLLARNLVRMAVQLGLKIQPAELKKPLKDPESQT